MVISSNLAMQKVNGDEFLKVVRSSTISRKCWLDFLINRWLSPGALTKIVVRI